MQLLAPRFRQGKQLNSRLQRGAVYDAVAQQSGHERPVLLAPRHHLGGRHIVRLQTEANLQIGVYVLNFYLV